MSEDVRVAFPRTEEIFDVEGVSTGRRSADVTVREFAISEASVSGCARIANILLNACVRSSSFKGEEAMAGPAAGGGRLEEMNGVS